jgi:hypothetical protein
MRKVRAMTIRTISVAVEGSCRERGLPSFWMRRRRTTKVRKVAI